MSLLLIIIICGVVLSLAYGVYGGFLFRWLRPDDRKTPAHAQYDGVDFVPARTAVVTGQHFSAIAAAGPIVGPILAGLYFGWLPALLWILLGAIFVGGVHDMASLFASIRHRACSIAEVVRQRMSRSVYLVFLLFIWLSLVYVIIAFADLTAASFAKATSFSVSFGVGSESAISISGGGVATAAVVYLGISVLLGLITFRWKASLLPGAVVSVLVIGFAIWFGQRYPLNWPATWNATKTWDWALLVYCFFASILPMWLLLQPRGFLGSLFLYAVLLVGIVGTIVGTFSSQLTLQFPMWRSETSPIGPLFPFLFITIACGACSGFHSIVSSGTTSKQLNCEKDIKPVAYGAMLLEAMVAVLALLTLMVLPATTSLKNPDAIFAQGIGRLLSFFGVPMEFAITFGLLAFSTFIFDTLDVCTRLGRYVFQELFGLQGKWAGAWATAATLAFPAIYLSVAPEGVWRQFWIIFGTSNQLLAALTLVGVSVWLKTQQRNPWPALAPAIFMLVITGIALFHSLSSFGKILASSQKISSIIFLNFGITLVLLALGFFVTVQAFKILSLKPAAASDSSQAQINF
ncbi:MAG: carbon starvation CstA family protein [Verrucomicrobiia bacterium]